MCLKLGILCGSARGSSVSGVLNCIYCCELAVGHFVSECEGSAGRGVLNFMFCCAFVVGHFVWECEGFSKEWCTELYVLLCVVIWTFCVGV